MKYTIIIVFLTCITLLTLLACASSPATGPAIMKAPESVSMETKKEGWQAQWDIWLQEARKEGTLVLYSGAALAPALKEMVPIFKNKFAINLDVVTGKGAELSAKLHRERTSGLYFTDVFFGGFDTTFNVKADGFSESSGNSLILPEVVNPGGWFQDRLPWGDDDKHVLAFLAYPSQNIAINTDFIKPAEITSFYDVLNPRWKNKIILYDPTIPSSFFNFFANTIFSKVLDLDFFRQLVLNCNI